MRLILYSSQTSIDKKRNVINLVDCFSFRHSSFGLIYRLSIYHVVGVAVNETTSLAGGLLFGQNLHLSRGQVSIFGHSLTTVSGQNKILGVRVSVQSIDFGVSIYDRRFSKNKNKNKCPCKLSCKQKNKPRLRVDTLCRVYRFTHFPLRKRT